MDRWLLPEPLAGEDDELTFPMRSACFSFRKWRNGARHVEFPSVWVRLVESSLRRKDVSSPHGGTLTRSENDGEFERVKRLTQQHVGLYAGALARFSSSPPPQVLWL